MQALKDARVVATYQDSPTTDYFIKLNPGRLAVGSGVMDASPEGIAVSKDNPVLYQAIATALNELKADLTYHRLILKWGLVHEEVAGVHPRPAA